MQKKRTFLWTFLLSAAVLFCVYGLYLRTHYSLDTYISYQIADSAAQHITQSRYLTAAISAALAAVNINPTNWMVPFTAVFILTMGFCLTRLTGAVAAASARGGYPLPRWACWLGCAGCFINVFILEWYLYPEYTLYYAIALTTALEAALALCRGRWLSAALLLMASLMTYQATLAMFLVWHLALTLLDGGFRAEKPVLARMALGVAIAAICSAMILILQRLVGAGGERDASLSLATLWNNAQRIWAAQPALWWNLRKLWPDGAFPVLCGVLGVVLVCVLPRLPRKRDGALLLAVLAVSAFVSFAPHLITRQVWLAQRTLVGLWCFVACGAVMLLALGRGRILRTVTAVVLAAMLGINGVYIHLIGQEHFRVNELDRAFAIELQSHIDAHEAETGEHIRKLGICRDEHFTYAYEGVRFWGHDTNKKCTSVDWGIMGALNHFCDRDYYQIRVDPALRQELFGGRDWTEFVPEEQLVFRDGAVYICFH